MFTLWLMPQGQLLSNLGEIIKKISQNHKTPAFEPHVTVLGDIENEIDPDQTKTQYLASQFGPFKIKFNNIGFSDKYFQCLYLLAEKNDELMAINQKAREIFNRESDPPFMPHLSLMYGDNIDQSIKDKISKEFENELINICFEAQAIQINSYKTPNPNFWQLTSKFPFKKKSQMTQHLVY